MITLNDPAENRKPICIGLMAAALFAFASLGRPTECRAGAAPSAALVFADTAGTPLAESDHIVTVDSYGKATKLTYNGARNDVVPAILLEPSGASSLSPAPCVLLIHGVGGSKEQMLPVARLLSNLGYASLSIDLPGFGERQREARQTFRSAADFSGYIAATLTRSVTDLRRGLDLLGAHPEIDPNRIGEIGISLGSFVGVDLAAADPRVKSVALVAAGGGLGSILAYQAGKKLSYGGSESALAAQLKSLPQAKASLASVDPLTYVDEIAPRPLLMENGADDAIIPPSAARALYAAAKQPKRIDVYPSQGHIPNPLSLYGPLSSFLAQTLGAPGKATDAVGLP